MGNLSCFLSQNAVKIENSKIVVSKRFLEKGKPVEWEIRAITTEEEEALRKSCTKKVPVPGKEDNTLKRLILIYI